MFSKDFISLPEGLNAVSKSSQHYQVYNSGGEILDSLFLFYFVHPKDMESSVCNFCKLPYR